MSNQNTINNTNILNDNSGINPNINRININNNINTLNINNDNTNNINNNNNITNINTNTNINNNNNPNLNIINTNLQNNQERIPEHEEEKKEEDEPFGDFEETNTVKNPANPPKKPSSSNIKKKLESKKYVCKMKLHGHEDEVNCVFETSDKLIISCSKDGNVLIWLLDQPDSPKTLKAHKNGVGCGLELKKNNLITGGGDGLIKSWNLEKDASLEEEYILKCHKNAIFSICKISDDKIASASCDKSIKIWDLNNKECKVIFEGHSGYIWGLILIEMNEKDENYKDEKKNLLVSCSSDKTIKFWDLKEERCYKTIYAHDREITALIQSSDGNIISGSLDSTIKILKL